MEEYEFIFETFDEAMNIHKQLFKLCRSKGYISCADLLSMTLKDEDSIKTVKSMDIYQTHGWTNLWDVKVEPIENGCNWVLKMPHVKMIKIVKEN